ncbi:UTRA domain-containing protein [Streptomyces sp. NPDC055189]
MPQAGPSRRDERLIQIARRATLAAHPRTPSATESKLLQLPAGEWVVELHRTTYTAEDTVVEFAIGVHAVTSFAWSYDFKVPDSAQEEGGKA